MKRTSTNNENYIKQLEETIKAKDRKIEALRSQLRERRVYGSRILNEIQRMNKSIISDKADFSNIIEQIKIFNQAFIGHHGDVLDTIDEIYLINENLLKEKTTLKQQEQELNQANKKLKEIAKAWQINYHKNFEAATTFYEKEKKLREKSEKLEAAYSKTFQKITDSINYAKKIQEAMMPDAIVVKNGLQDSFIYWQPKDIVSGDFYWMCEKNYKIVVAAVDCTGHGVPGAIMSAVGIRLLNEIVHVKGILNPAEILFELDNEINNMLSHSKEKRREGMDAAICVIDNIPEYYKNYIKEKKIRYAGARQPLVLIKNRELQRIKGDKKSIGEKSLLGGESEFRYTEHEIDVDEPIEFYIFSDGFQDQFGGLGKKFSLRRLEQILLDNHTKSMDEQKEIITNEFLIWKGDEQQIDDVTLLGFRVGN